MCNMDSLYKRQRSSKGCQNVDLKENIKDTNYKLDTMKAILDELSGSRNFVKACDRRA